LQSQRDQLKARVKEQKQVLKFAKDACRKKGRCFQVPGSPSEKKSRSISERILREIRRVPRNLLGRSEPATDVPELKSNDLARREPELLVTPAERYRAWIETHEPHAPMLEKQSSASQLWPAQPKISLLLPILNTPARFLEEMFSSVANQTYGNWQLCLVDAGSTNSETLEVLERWVARESRMCLERLDSNLGIAENTNRALKLATGDFIACVDHDDLVGPFALYELARAITNNPDGEIFYSDEDRITVDGKRHSPFFKPEWSPEFLLSSMYLGHLTAYRRELVERVGGLRKEFDLSQDYDFALRATEQARAIYHVPHVLYHWREHPASGSAGGKPEARKTNLAALRDAMNRRGLSADVIEYPTANRVRFKISEWPKVSIIVPTDSAERARRCMEHLPQSTSYPDYEIVIVTKSALADPLEIAAPSSADFRFVRYDKPFNFSEKCNLGAQAATGSRLIFFNDDVESGQGDWIQNLIEPLENPEVGGVAPKLLYSNGKIQHAGLVTGVRGLVGTACHQWPGDSIDYQNFAQSMRDVSALSAACLAMRREDFFRLGEFDVVHTPIAHSDLDLSFKIREAGMRCVYTPFVTMTHRGHASIGALEGEEETRARQKASVYLLQRWAGYSCNDPYYPVNVRDWLYADSPTRIRMWGRNERGARESKADLLFVSHDLSWSGAPLIQLHVAKWCRDQGFFVAVMSPKDGPLRGKVFEAGIPLLVDPLITTGHSSFTAFAEEFDCVIASTIFGAPIVRAAKSKQVPHVWWIHEGRIAEHYLGEDAELRRTLGLADLIVTPDTRSSQVYQPFADRPIRVLSYGIPDPAGKVASAIRRKGEPLKFLLLGTIEQRKGQQILLEALRKLPADVLKHARFRIVGRPHDSAITAEIKAAASEFSYLSYEDGVSPEEALALIGNTDVMVCSSWDETGPLILMEALALGKAILSTTVGAVAESLSDEEHGLFFPPGDAVTLAAAVARLVREPDLVERLSKNSRLAYERYFTFDRFAHGFAGLLSEASASRSSALSAGQSSPPQLILAE
ncbi:MAG: glycosyltransferase, partial [Chthoniobacterales bacterium]